MCDEKIRQIFITGLEQDREITAIDHVPRRLERFGALDEIPKIRNHLWRAAGKIDNRNLCFGQPINDSVDRFASHDFLALRAGVHVTVHAGEIAQPADVDLKNFGPRMPKFQAFLKKSRREPTHALSLHVIAG